MTPHLTAFPHGSTNTGYFTVNTRDWVSDPEGIRNNDRDALIMLMEGLIMSGLAMQVAG